MLQGNVEPVLIALCLLAVERHLDGRRGQALALVGAAALLRPEAGPLLALYAVALLWREPGRWRVAVPVLAAVPLLWFGGDWWVSGDPFTGSDRAQVLEGTATERATLAVERIVDMVIVPVWAAAAGCVVWAGAQQADAPRRPRGGGAAVGGSGGAHGRRVRLRGTEPLPGPSRRRAVRAGRDRGGPCRHRAAPGGVPAGRRASAAARWPSTPRCPRWRLGPRSPRRSTYRWRRSTTASGVGPA